MARFGTFKYGTSVRYGPTGIAPLTTMLLWSMLVDWDNDGYYSGENEATRMTGFRCSRGRDNFIKSDLSGFEHYSPGEAVITLDNSDGRYDPYNTSSPLYPNVSPGRRVRLGVKNGTSGLDYNIMRGTISNIQPYNDGMRKRVVITVLDGLNWLRTQPVIIGKQENKTYGDLVKTVLDTCTFPSTEWTYSTNANGNVIPYFWSTSGQSALDIIHGLDDAEGGIFRHTSGGSFVWSAKTTAPVTTTVVTEEHLLTDIVIPQPWDSVINRVRMVINPLTTHNITTTIWALEKVVSLPHYGRYETEAFFKHPTLSIPICQDNIESYNFAVNTAADGSGTNITSSCVMMPGPAGESVKLVFLNANALDGYIISANIVGDAIYANYENVISADDLTSQARYGVRSLTIDTPWMQRGDVVAQPYATYLVNQLKNPRPNPVVKIENRPTLQYDYDLYLHAINLQLATVGLNDTYRIGKIEHEWLNENGQSVRTTWKLEPYMTPYV